MILNLVNFVKQCEKEEYRPTIFVFIEENKMRRLLISVSLIFVMLGVGCAALSHYATYSEIDSKAVKYVVDAGVADANEYTGWWKQNMVWAEKLKVDVDSAYNVIHQSLKHMIEKNDLSYSIHKEVVASNYIVAQQREEIWFGEKGLASMGLGLLGFGGFTGILGLMRKRPGDITPPEMENALALVTSEASKDLFIKDKQFTQLVKGVQVFIDEYKGTTDDKEAVMLKTLKTFLNAKQDEDTQVAVAVAKKLRNVNCVI